MALFEQQPTAARTWINYGGDKRLEVHLSRSFEAQANVFMWQLVFRGGSVTEFGDDVALDALDDSLRSHLGVLSVGETLTEPIIAAIKAWIAEQQPKLQKFMEEKQNG